ncbi:coiled-coil domain-containing protein 112-like [Corticium candelabrum]|uniref:coiled-coil domain-containing protein 112-like n=1 Tax=Corticium candelabrum TaxID=121492 RepID=UPI002E26B0A6|nr:coiled-coil domain-containing protein 112-like [Corticium candelabrum]
MAVATQHQRLSEKQRKLDALVTLEQLGARGAALERETAIHLYNKRSEFRHEYCDLEETDGRMTEGRKQEKAKLKLQLSRVHTSVSRFRRSLQDAKPSSDLVQKLKEMMEEIETSILSFKNHQREIYEMLSKEEKVVSQEVSAFEKRIYSWSSRDAVGDAIAMKPKKVQTAESKEEMPPAVTAFERFLQQTGGHQGGWDDYDHQTFLRIYKTHKGNPVFLTTALAVLPGHSEDDIMEHVQWYSEYLTLKDSQKEAIRKWKDMKQSEKAEMLIKGEAEEQRTLVNLDQKKQERMDKERAERLSKVASYKAEQELKRLAEEEERLKREVMQAREEQRQKRQRAAVKMKVEEYCKQKAEEKEIMELASDALRHEEMEKRRAANKQIDRFQERDRAAFDERKLRQQKQAMQDEERTKRLTKLKGQVDVHVERDPSRLYKLTEGWENRKKDNTTSHGGAVVSLPKRAVPSWRVGV